jgi:protein-S-isoprenylcysteine O-methyltransferase Ste14
MKGYDRLFGSGPRGIVISVALFALAWIMAGRLGGVPLLESDMLRWTVFAGSLLAAAAVAVWSFKSLPVASRGLVLITSGPYRYVRHPLYAALVSCFNWGLAVLLNNWIFLLWAAAVQGVWHWTIRREEKLMSQAFPRRYPGYCRMTPRFFPSLRSLSVLRRSSSVPPGEA